MKKPIMAAAAAFLITAVCIFAAFGEEHFDGTVETATEAMEAVTEGIASDSEEAADPAEAYKNTRFPDIEEALEGHTIKTSEIVWPKPEVEKTDHWSTIVYTFPEKAYADFGDARLYASLLEDAYGFELEQRGIKEKYIGRKTGTWEEIIGDTLEKVGGIGKLIYVDGTASIQVFSGTGFKKTESGLVANRDGLLTLVIVYDDPRFGGSGSLPGSGGPENQVYTDAGTIMLVQKALNKAGFDCGAADGISGRRTKAGVNAFREAHRLEMNGQIDDVLLQELGIETSR